MHPQFWFDSWEREGSATSFHRHDIHPFVLDYATPESLRGKRVLVPLCGKTNDLLWFARHADHVIGVELVEKAIVQFFHQNGLSYQQNGYRYESERITLLHRDMFDVTCEDVGRIDLVYDRAALVALPHDMRLRYIAKLDELIPVGAQQLVVTLEYAPLLPEPPFSITPEETFSYYGPGYTVEHIEQPERPEHRMIPKFGLSFLREHGFMATKIGPHITA
ncbi:MAG TPA: thiopurine S-methyltransferase [Herpetosiphonaceae bacterium]